MLLQLILRGHVLPSQVVLSRSPKGRAAMIVFAFRNAIEMHAAALSAALRRARLVSLKKRGLLTGWVNMKPVLRKFCLRR